MATQTTNLNLSKPEYTDDADIDVINTNMDTLDRVIGGTAMGTTASTITGAIAEHNGLIGNTSMGTTASTLTGAIKENHDAVVLTNTDLNRVYGTLGSDMGIVVNGSTSTKNISAGQYVVVVNSTITDISDGLYTANSAVIAGTALTSTNLTAVGNGGFNAITPIDKGGTGASTAAGARDALGLGNTTGALPIANGGSGMTNKSKSSISSSTTGIGATIYYYKWGKIVYVNIYAKFTKAVAKNTAFFTLPEGYRPPSGISVRIPCRYDSDWKFGSLADTGAFSVNIDVEKDKTFYGWACYVTE